MGDLHGMAVRTQVALAGLDRARQLTHRGAPLRRVLVALEVESVLDARGSAVVRLGVRAIRARGVVLVADPLGTVGEHLVVVVRRLGCSAMAMGRADRLLRLVVVGLEVGEGDRPVEQVGPLDVAVVGLGLELVLLEPRRRAAPVRGRAANSLDDPGRQVREILGHPVATGRGAVVEPRHLGERRPFIVLVVLGLDPRPGLQHYARDAALGQLIREGAATGAGADDDDGLGVMVDRVAELYGVLEVTHGLTAPHALAGWSCSATSTNSSGPSYSSILGVGSQSRSSKPRSMYPPLSKEAALIAEQLPDLVVVVQADDCDARR